MGSEIDARDPSQGIRAAMMADPRVRSVKLIGSRAAGTATQLSDWDYRITSADPGAVASQLPNLIAGLRPLAQQWDPLASTPVYMIILPGAVKADLFPGISASTLPVNRTRTGWAELRDIDAHFWDWNLWLAAKRLRGQDELVNSELAKMWHYLLHDLGATRRPATQEEAISVYLKLRHGREQQLSRTVSRDLGNAVVARLESAGLL